MKSRAQRGFTLVEVMITVVVIAILAAIVVPLFTKESNKSKARSEVAAMFAEIQNKEEIYKSEISTTQSYGALAACGTPSPSATNSYASGSTCTSATDYAALGLAAPETTMMCTYTVKVGAAGTNPNTVSGLPSAVTSSASFTAYNTNPAESWYVVWAQCDTDNSTTTDSYYVSSNVDSTIQKINEGH